MLDDVAAARGRGRGKAVARGKDPTGQAASGKDPTTGQVAGGKDPTGQPVAAGKDPFAVALDVCETMLHLIQEVQAARTRRLERGIGGPRAFGMDDYTLRTIPVR